VRTGGGSFRGSLGCQLCIRRFAIMQCPECGSKRIHLSRRKGLLEKGILASIFLRPFRCEHCDSRFFRFSFTSHPSHSGTAATN